MVKHTFISLLKHLASNFSMLIEMDPWTMKPWTVRKMVWEQRANQKREASLKRVRLRREAQVERARRKAQDETLAASSNSSPATLVSQPAKVSIKDPTKRMPPTWEVHESRSRSILWILRYVLDQCIQEFRCSTMFKEEVTSVAASCFVQGFEDSKAHIKG